MDAVVPDTGPPFLEGPRALRVGMPDGLLDGVMAPAYVVDGEGSIIAANEAAGTSCRGPPRISSARTHMTCSTVTATVTPCRAPVARCVTPCSRNAPGTATSGGSPAGTAACSGCPGS